MKRPIPDWPEYEITPTGELWSIRCERWLKPSMAAGYKHIVLYSGEKEIGKSIHCLILETFVGPCPNGMEACHNNGIKTDNRLDNLRWDTRSNNQKDAIKHGTAPCLHQIGSKHPNSKLTEQGVRMIIYMYRTGLFTQREIAKVYNITTSNISNIVNKKTWKHLWGEQLCVLQS